MIVSLKGSVVCVCHCACLFKCVLFVCSPSQCRTLYRVHSEHSQLSEEHTSQSPCYRRHSANSYHQSCQWPPDQLPGIHLYTWMEYSNVDTISCWRMKVPGIDGNRSRTSKLLIRNQYGSIQFTTALPHTCTVLETAWLSSWLMSNALMP